MSLLASAGTIAAVGYIVVLMMLIGVLTWFGRKS